jgi:ribosomal protein L19
VKVSDPLRGELERRAIGAREAVRGRNEIAAGDLECLTFARRPTVESLAVLAQSGVAVGGYARADLSYVRALLGELGEVEAST